jgi:transaldolase
MKNYFDWLVENTPTTWWHDSGDLAELESSLANQASGVTTNPVLIAAALRSCGKQWHDELRQVFDQGLPDSDRAVELTGVVVRSIAARLSSIYAERGDRCGGYVCAQVNPGCVADRDTMLSTARWYADIAPNISVKFPATIAGLEAAETCLVEGISVTLTVSFTVAQALAVGEMYERAAARAAAKGIAPGKCCAVLMIGRIDDYIRNVACDLNPQFREADVRQAGIAVVKKTYEIYQDRGYQAILCIAALRGPYHMTEIAGADLIVSIHPKMYKPLLLPDIPREARIDLPVDADVLERLASVPEFARAYDPAGIRPDEFLSYGATQCTLSQFIETGWKKIESFRLEDCQ